MTFHKNQGRVPGSGRPRGRLTGQPGTGEKAAKRKNLAAKTVAQPGAIHELLKTLEAAAEIRTFKKAQFFQPYAKQQEFFDMGTWAEERLLMAGNQLGKSEAGAFEAYVHLTGDYPDWWLGRRFDHPTKGWIAGETSLLARDVQQKKLCGEPGVESMFGSGMIPKDAFTEKPSLARGVTDAYDTIWVQHRTNGVIDGVSIAKFKSYEQGRTKFQGETLDWVWFDEEPDMDIYSEGITRYTATAGMSWMTFTPLKGMSTVVNRFLNEPSPKRGVVTMTIDDALHISPEQRADIIAKYPAHEREARTKGIPMLGSGRIFPYAEEAITEAPITHLPAHWAKLWGIDFGIGHPFAAALIAWDRDNDVIHLLHTIRIADQKPLQHAAAMKPVGGTVPVAWPQDGTAREKGSGESVSKFYKDQGLHMLHDHATWPDGSVSTEAGVLELQQRMETGRFKVGAHLSDFFDEFRLYHRKDGAIVKMKDDILSALRVAVMMKRYAKAVVLGPAGTRKGNKDGVASGVDFDYFA